MLVIANGLYMIVLGNLANLCSKIIGLIKWVNVCCCCSNGMRRNIKNKFNMMKINVQIHMIGTQLQRQIYELNMSNKEIQKGNYIWICVIKHWRSCVPLGWKKLWDFGRHPCLLHLFRSWFLYVWFNIFPSEEELWTWWILFCTECFFFSLMWEMRITSWCLFL